MLGALHSSGSDRVGVYDLENTNGNPIYVHSKICVIDDVWMTVGSDNLNRRSWTHDSELSCAVIDTRTDERAPHDPGGFGDGARHLARESRIRLGAEHLGRASGQTDDLVDPASGSTHSDPVRPSSTSGTDAARPAARRPSAPAPRAVRELHGGDVRALRVLLDPDGRPPELSRLGEFSAAQNRAAEPLGNWDRRSGSGRPKSMARRLNNAKRMSLRAELFRLPI